MEITAFRQGSSAKDIASRYGLDAERSVDDPDLPWRLQRTLLRQPVIADALSPNATEQIQIDRLTVHLTNNELPEDAWRSVGLDHHIPLTMDEATRGRLIAALGLVAANPKSAGLFGNFVRSIIFVGVEPGGRLITSCSVPDMPFAVFISERAFRHIPPTSVSERSSAYLGAENLYHEAVHQAVSFALINLGLLPPEYRSETSPRVPIFWREEDVEERNTAWELDRVLHAATVYAHLVPWRNDLIKSGDLSIDDDGLTRAALRDAIPALSALLDALDEHREHFSQAGRLFIDELASSTRPALAEARDLVALR